jgi:hypothetical protein
MYKWNRSFHTSEFSGAKIDGSKKTEMSLLSLNFRVQLIRTYEGFLEAFHHRTSPNWKENFL